MGLIETLGWAAVELQSTAPDMGAIRRAIELAFVEAAKLELNHDVRKENLVRLAALTGGH